MTMFSPAVRVDRCHKAPVPRLAESMCPSMTVLPDADPGIRLPTHQPTEAGSSGTVKTPWWVTTDSTAARTPNVGNSNNTGIPTFASAAFTCEPGPVPWAARSAGCAGIGAGTGVRRLPATVGRAGGVRVFGALEVTGAGVPIPSAGFG